MHESKMDAIVKIALHAARVLLTLAVSLVFVLAALVVTSYVAIQTTQRGLHQPPSVTLYIRFVSGLIEHIARHLVAYLGWYLSFFGLFSASAEIIASARSVDFQQDLAESLRKSLVNVRAILSGGFGLAAIVAVFLLIGRNLIASRVFVSLRGIEALKAQGWYEYLETALTFDFQSRLMLIGYAAAPIVLLTITLAVARLAWSFGFVAFLRYLMMFSACIARRFKVENASAPIASILMTLIGMIMTLLTMNTSP